MPIGKKKNNWDRRQQIAAIVLFLVCLGILIYGMLGLFRELRNIDDGQQELILHLSQQDAGRERMTVPETNNQCASPAELEKISQEITSLKEEIKQLRQTVRTLKSHR